MSSSISVLDALVQPHNLRASSVWSSGGHAYEQISRGIADALEHTVLRLDPAPRERVLDVATGTGWTSRLVARRGARVIGVDIAADLIAVARERAAGEGLPIEYRIGDAERLPFADGEFDAVVSTFGVMFVGRPEVAASELARVVRPGGRLALATWTPDGHVYGMFRVMRRYMPLPPDPAPPSPFAWGRVSRLHELLGHAFDLGFEPATSFYREPTPSAAWETFVAGYGPLRALAAGLDDVRRQRLRDDFIAFHAGFTTELGVTVPREYVMALGIRR